MAKEPPILVGKKLAIGIAARLLLEAENSTDHQRLQDLNGLADS